MLRIRALNEDSNSSGNEEHEPEVTKEAQETIASSEYVRALSLKRSGETEAALNLFLELLETQVLHETSDRTKKLFSIKYNCFRNASFILEELGQNERALHYVKKAVAMDDTDIYTLNIAGHLALQFKESDYAMVLFQRCQEFNPNHWPSADGMLRVLCMHRNFMGAYGWAMQWHQRDETYERAIKVLVELHEQFQAHIPMFEEMYRAKFDYEKHKHIRPEPSCFDEWTYPDASQPQVKYKDLSRFRMTELTWLTVGEWIINVYEECCEEPENLIRMHSWCELLVRDQSENGNSNPQPAREGQEENNNTTTAANPNDQENTTGEPSAPLDGNDSQMVDTPETTTNPLAKSSDDSSDVKTDVEKDNKPKKRRGSDLSFLEQWGWHKNRRHSRKHSLPAEPAEPTADLTIATFLKQAFAKYYHLSFDVNDSPFAAEGEERPEGVLGEEKTDEKHHRATDCFKAPPTEQETDFQKLTQTEFDAFLGEFEYFDVIPLLYKWLEYTSSFWRLAVPPQIRQQYVKIYSFYWTHYAFQQWSCLPCDEFKQVYAMGLFYVEQALEAVQSRAGKKGELLGDDFHSLRNQLMFHSGYFCLDATDEFVMRICRYHWGNYLLARLENNLEMCLQALMHIVLHLERQPAEQRTTAIRLPCKTQDAVIELELVKGLIRTLERTISLNNVGRLYAGEKYKELIPILKESLINCTTIKSADNSVMKLRTQFEILLECLWNVGDYEGCLVWAERCFKYAIDLYETIPEFSYRLKDWGAAINFILTYFDALVNKYSVDVLMTLGRNQCRLVQNLVRLVVHQLDVPLDKNNPEVHAVDLKTPWILLYLVRERDEVSNCPLVGVKAADGGEEGGGGDSNGDEESGDDEEDHIPKSFLLLFTAHEYLGRKMWCTKDGGGLLKFTANKVGPLLRTPMLEPFRDIISEYLEQVTYCLFAYPPKKARSRHLEEHDATQMELKWEDAVELFDIYRPDVLPEFDAYKVDSISVDMEQLLQKMLPLIPPQFDLTASAAAVNDFIAGRVDRLPDQLNAPPLPHRVSPIYYLIADYHFKNRDFIKPTKFYVLDLALHPWRFDSWAGVALSKATLAETKINRLNAFNAQEFLRKSEDAIRCFETCLKLRDKHTMLWIEYGSFAYMLHSFCSRNLKQASETLSMDGFAVLETYKEKFLRTAYNCFHTVDLYLLEAATPSAGKQKEGGGRVGVTGEGGVVVAVEEEEEEEENHDEKWLYHYMLGKVAEKKKDAPKVYLEHYLKASKYLYECNATYPYKINHSNPQNLSIEALEIFYRITSTILKYLETHEVVTRDVGKLFERMLRELSTSPFTYNKAKLDNNSINALKRKIASQEEQEKKNKAAEEEEKRPVDALPDVVEEKIEPFVVEKKMKLDEGGVTATKGVTSPSRRISQESTATSATTTTTSRTTTTSSTSSSSSSSDSSSDEDEDANGNLTERELQLIYGICVKNLEECLGRFPEHYKSINRLVHHYLYAPQKLRNMSKARELLLSTYVTSMGTKVQGLFADRKGNNFFNGIWRIPSSEIDRPGSFAAHLSKAVILLLEVLKASSEYEVTFDLAVQLYKSPDPDKMYIKDSECKELLLQTISCCCQSFRNILRRHTNADEGKRNDYELVNLILEVNKLYRKCVKLIPGKEAAFGQVMVDVYKAYCEDKVRKLPEHFNAMDLATKFCNYEIQRRKNAEKGLPLGPVQLPGIPVSLLVSSGGSNVSGGGVTGKQYENMGIPSLPRSTTISVAPPITDSTLSGVGGKPSNAGGSQGAPGTAAAGTTKARGRPVGSKNVAVSGGGTTAAAAGSSSAAAMKQMMGNMDPNMLKNMSALMSMYANPKVSNDPDVMNKMILEYYKIILGSASPMALGQLNAAAAASGPVAPPKAKQRQTNPSTGTSSSLAVKQPLSQGSAVKSGVPPYSSQSVSSAGQSSMPKSMPKYDMSSLIQSAASSILKDPAQASKPHQLQAMAAAQPQNNNTISLGGGQLTITPTALPPMQHHPQGSSLGGKGKGAATSDDAQRASMKRSYMPELPKSLTITPASASAGGRAQSSSSSSASGGSQGGGGSAVGSKGGSKQSAKHSVTMSKVSNTSAQAAAAALQQQQMKKYAQAMQAMMPGSNKEYDEMYLKTMAAYSEMVRGQMGAPQQQKPQSLVAQSQPQKKKQAAGTTMSKLSEAVGSSSAAYPISAMPRFPQNMTFQDQHQQQQAKQLLAAHAALSGGQGGGAGGGSGGGAPKTLQQKMAERQKANSLLESKSLGVQQQQQQMMRSSNSSISSGNMVYMPPKRKASSDPQHQAADKGPPPPPRPKKNPKVDVIILD